MKERLYEIVFEAETKAGRQFDVLLLWAIILSVLAVMLESVEELQLQYGYYLKVTEWVFTILFTIEYFLRIYIARHRSGYIFSFFGLIDFLAVIPTYLSLFIFGYHYLMIIRILRLLRVFRVLKLVRFLGEAEILKAAMKSSRHKIFIFLGFVLSLVTILGTFMYIIEGPENGFTNIPISIYWAIVTLTTVGYGDIAPGTNLGRALSSLIMILGYAIIAVPTGIVTAEITQANKLRKFQTCDNCFLENHDQDAKFCKKCGSKLPEIGN